MWLIVWFLMVHNTILTQPFGEINYISRVYTHNCRVEDVLYSLVYLGLTLFGIKRSTMTFEINHLFCNN